MARKKPSSAVLFAVLPLLLATAPLGALGVEVARVTSVPFVPGAGSEWPSRVLAMTPDARFLLMDTLATTLVAGFPDTNGATDLLVYDREAGQLEWITFSVLDDRLPALSQIVDATLSGDGRFVAYSSAGRRHARGTQGYQIYQVYLFDRQSRTTVKVSHPPGDPLGHGSSHSSGAFLSHDGRYLAYQSVATNLTSGADGNGGPDVYCYDRLTGVSTLVSHSFAAPGNTASTPSILAGISADGRFVLLRSNAANLVEGFVPGAASQDNLYLWDRESNSSLLASHTPASPLAGLNSGILASQLSADGSRAAFATYATNLIAGFSDGNGPNQPDVYVYERATGAVQLVSGISATQSQSLGSSLAGLSADGRRVLFYSKAADAIPGLIRPADNGDGLFAFDTGTRAVALINHRAGQPATVALGGASAARISPSGEALLFVNSGTELVAGQVAGSERQLFAYDLAAGTARLLSHLPGRPLEGTSGEYPIGLSADHRYAAFSSNSSELAALDQNNGNQDAFLYDLDRGAVRRLSTTASSGLMASKGRFEQLESIPAAGLFLFHAENVTPLLPSITDHGGFDPLLFDPRTGALTALVAPGGATPDGESRATFAADGLTFLLRSTGSGLVPGMVDGNGGGADLYAGNRTRGGLELISSSGASASTSGNGGIGGHLAISASGRFVAYDTVASNAVAGVSDSNGATDVVLHDRQLGTRALVSRAAGTAAAANSSSQPLAISADGELLLISSFATDLVSGFTDLNGPLGDLYLYRRSSGSLTLVSHAAGSSTQSGDSDSSWTGLLSADGRFVYFVSRARNLVPGMVDRNGNGYDVFVLATETGAISLVSHAAGQPLLGADGDAELVAISADGRYALLGSRAKQLIGPAGDFPTSFRQTFVYDRLRDRISLISHPPGLPFSSLLFSSPPAAMSGDGRFVAFQTDAPNVVAGQTLDGLENRPNLFVADRATGETTLLTRSLEGPAATSNGQSHSLALGPGSRQAMFLSQATNLAPHHGAVVFEIHAADLSAGGSEVFSDGFELGDSSLWSKTYGAP